MRVLFWTTSALPNIGGLEVATHRLARQLQQMGHQILMLSTNCHSLDIREMVLNEVSIIVLPFTLALLNKNMSIVKGAILHVNHVIETFKPDIINIHGWFEVYSFFQWLTLEKTNIPICITLHGLLEQKSYDTTACQKIWALARAVSTVSNSLLKSCDQYQLSHRSLRCIYNGLPKLFSPSKSVSISPPILVMVGRVSEEKCFDVGFYALQLLVSKYPNIRLILVGDGPLLDSLKVLKDQLGLSNQITLTGSVRPDEVYSYLDQASVVLVPSSYESFCLVALEAAMCARPVVASAVLGLTEVVKDGETGLLVPPNDPEALAKAVDELLSQPQKAIAMGRAAQIRADQLFSVEKMATEYEKMYQEVLENYHE